jgi:hypothetical protein
MVRSAAVPWPARESFEQKGNTVKKKWGHRVAAITAAGGLGLGLLAVGSLFANPVFASPSAGAKTPFVTAKAPARTTIAAFKGGALAVTVTCKQACRTTVSATIRAADAKRLGFPGVKGKLVVVGTGNKTLKALTATKIRVVPTAAAKKRLQGTVAIVGVTKGVPAKPGPANNYFVEWYTTLS